MATNTGRFATDKNMDYAAKKQLQLFVKKETGKNLIADSDVEKLGGIEEKAQVNVIESVKVNGTEVLIAEDKSVNIELPSASDVEETVKDAVDTAMEEVNNKLSAVYKPQGSLSFADMGSAVKKNGYVYNITDAFTTTTEFAEGAGHKYPAGTNVAWIADVDESGEELTTGKWDALAGIVDLSGFVTKEEIEGEITESDIDAMYGIVTPEA